jgi:broad specificity phosphatase PhoE
VALEKFGAMNHQSIICVTHGKFLGALFKSILNVPVKEFHDNAWVEMEIDSSGKLTLGKTEGIDLA